MFFSGRDLSDGASPVDDDEQEGMGHRLLIVDPEALSRQTFARLVAARCPDLDVACSGRIEEEGCLFPDLVVIDIKAADPADAAAIETVARAKAAYPDARLVVKCDRAREGLAGTCAGMGIAGLIPATLGVAGAIAALRLVLCHEAYYPLECTDRKLKLKLSAREGAAGGGEPTVAAVVRHNAVAFRRPSGAADSGPSPTGPESRKQVQLTPREQEVVDRLRQGKPNKIIAYELQMSLSTVKVHLRNIMRKMQVRNRTQVVLHESVTGAARRRRADGDGDARPFRPASALTRLRLPA